MANKKTAIEKAEQDWQYMKDYAKKHPLVYKQKTIVQVLEDREERSKSQQIDNSKEWLIEAKR